MAGLRNDEKLIRLGYVNDLSIKAETFTCGECGAEFVDLGTRDAHGQRQHPRFVRELSPLEEDAEATREARLLNEIAPLNLGNTAGARA